MSTPQDKGRRPGNLPLGASIALGLVVVAAAISLSGLGRRFDLLKAAEPPLVVASSRDDGPGTLRDAILAADRLSSHAHIVITAKRIALDSPLPVLVNPRGVQIDAHAHDGLIDAAHQATGPTLQINSPFTEIKGLHITDAPVSGIVVNAPGARLDGVQIADSKAGILIYPTARGTIVENSVLQHDQIGIAVSPGVEHIALLNSVFRRNTRAGLWYVGPPARVGGTRITRTPSVTEAGLRVVDSVFEKNAEGAVLANQSAQLQRTRFLDSGDTAILIMGGSVGIQSAEIRGSGGPAVSVSSGAHVQIAHSTLIDNASSAIMARDSDLIVEGNTLEHNGLGIVSIGGGSFTPVIRDNLITGSTGDAITLIGGPMLIEHNRLLQNHGAALRPFDFVQRQIRFDAAPKLDGNTFRANGLDVAPTTTYTLRSAP
jgi:Right handed beta helix region